MPLLRKGVRKRGWAGAPEEEEGPSSPSHRPAWGLRLPECGVCKVGQVHSPTGPRTVVPSWERWPSHLSTSFAGARCSGSREQRGAPRHQPGQLGPPAASGRHEGSLHQLKGCTDKSLLRTTEQASVCVDWIFASFSLLPDPTLSPAQAAARGSSQAGRLRPK